MAEGATNKWGKVLSVTLLEDRRLGKPNFRVFKTKTTTKKLQIKLNSPYLYITDVLKENVKI